MAEFLTLKIEPDHISVEVEKNTPLSEALEKAGVDFAYPCARARLCGKCRVRFEKGAPTPTPEETRLLTYGEMEAGTRLACCCVLEEDAEILVPGRENVRKEHILNAGVKSQVVIDPEVKKFCCELPPSTLEEPRSDWSRTTQALPDRYRADVRPTLDVLRRLPDLVRCAAADNNPVTVTLRQNRVINVECGDHRDAHYGVAVDLGTTTIAAVLVDMKTGEELSAAGMMNPQRRYGHDLISRIHAVQDDYKTLNVLHEAVRETIGGLIRQMCEEQGIAPEKICAMSLAGNTVMSHLFLNIDPRPLGHAPFAGTLRAGVRLEGRDLDLPVHPHAPVYVLPCMGGFVGGDIVAGILLTRLAQRQGVNVLVDIGTNGEVAVAKDGKVFTTSSAAGPAFEGGKISCGAIASDGAINAVTFDGKDFVISTLGDEPARGICGSGLIELLARSVETGLIGANGRIAAPEGLEEKTPALARRVQKDEKGQPRIVLTPAEDGRDEVFLSQEDIREFQLGKGAVQTAIVMVLEEMGISLAEVDSLMVAGAFGNHLNGEDAITLGLLPDLDREKIFFIGNSSLEGARCVLLNQYERQRTERIAEESQFVELATRPEFQDRFAMSMMLMPAM